MLTLKNRSGDPITSVDTSAGPVLAVALEPMAVLPEHQRQGIGGTLIRRGLDTLRDSGERIVIVVGHPSYYPRGRDRDDPPPRR